MSDHLATDATAFSPSLNELRCCYFGWPLADLSDLQQDLSLKKPSSPEVAQRDIDIYISSVTAIGVMR